MLYGDGLARACLGKAGKSWKNTCYPMAFCGPTLAKLRAALAERARALDLAEPALALAS